MLMEQVYENVPPGPGSVALEELPPSVQKLAELADDYTLARRGNNSGSSGQSRYYSSGPNHGSKLDIASGQTSTQELSCREKVFSVRKVGAPNVQLSREAQQQGEGWDKASTPGMLRGGMEPQEPAEGYCQWQMLVDTGYSLTMVSVDLVPEVSHKSISVLCVHGYTMQHPTAEVELRTGSWRKQVWVAVAPHLPVDVVLGTDIFCLEVSEEVKPSLTVQKGVMQSRRAPS